MWLVRRKRSIAPGVARSQEAFEPRFTHGCLSFYLRSITRNREIAKWLGEIEVGDLKELLKPYPANEMKLWPIGLRVNSPKNNDPDILMPIED